MNLGIILPIIVQFNMNYCDYLQGTNAETSIDITHVSIQIFFLAYVTLVNGQYNSLQSLADNFLFGFCRAENRPILGFR